MDANEREIYNYLLTWGEEFISAKEICRRASTKKRYHDEPDWAKPILQVMFERSILDRDTLGRYRIKPAKKKHGGRWVAPDIAKLLKENGVEMDGDSAETIPVDDSDQP